MMPKTLIRRVGRRLVGNPIGFACEDFNKVGKYYQGFVRLY
jgi:hypothetical protein